MVCEVLVNRSWSIAALFQRVGTKHDKPVLARHDVGMIDESSNGDLLLATTNQGFVVWNGSQAAPYPEIAAQLGVNAGDILHVFEDGRGTI